ncbi:PilZ domain-containing protein [Geoalkalibacter halelectricus]|uniref:PilZ domain-containing protein n=1 Tax=Geoalkalibacter halelectricus TaxID=2847045 RepID=A0ABY5ZUA5_9BACT|nr:PilZ domain-containing protein [Geoalkalibacter halelectricus]MDO3377007.1 PilZ domain-containing protein [Geoalkalibacter halelectricus]UWZ81229.1 PilZ domain-containing protein [Geoalkalibacter halelectricus]
MSRKILIAIPEEDFLDRVEGFFGREEFILVRARDGEQAWRLIEEEDPVLAFVSLHLPPDGGDVFCRRIKKDFLLRHTRLILLVQASEEDSERCRESGADAIVSLPADWTTLLDSSRRLLNLPDPGRLAPRAPLSVPLRYRRLPAGDFECGTTANVSTGGLFLQGDVLYPRDSRLEVVLDLTAYGGPLLSVTARVAWVNHPEWLRKPQFPCGMGLELLDLSLHDLARLEALVSQYLSSPSS